MWDQWIARNPNSATTFDVRFPARSGAPTCNKQQACRSSGRRLWGGCKLRSNRVIRPKVAAAGVVSRDSRSWIRIASWHGVHAPVCGRSVPPCGDAENGPRLTSPPGSVPTALQAPGPQPALYSAAQARSPRGPGRAAHCTRPDTELGSRQGGAFMRRAMECRRMCGES